MKVAVTGASGFIGTHLTDYLERSGDQVIALTRDSTGSSFTSPTDSRNRPDAPLAESLDGTEAVIHLAARQQDSPATPFRDYVPSNVLLTEHLLQAAVEAGVGTFVLASSRLVYPSSLNRPASEDCALPPDSFYGLSKRVAEILIGTYGTRHDIRCSALRIAQVFGSGDKGRGVLPSFIEKARRGEPLQVSGAGVAVRDFVDVRDVVRAFRMVVDARESPPLLNIGGGRGYAIAEFAAIVTKAAGMDPESVSHLPVEDEDRSHFSLDCTLAETAIGWRPEQSLERAIADRLAVRA